MELDNFKTKFKKEFKKCWPGPGFLFTDRDILKIFDERVYGLRDFTEMAATLKYLTDTRQGHTPRLVEEIIDADYVYTNMTKTDRPDVSLCPGLSTHFCDGLLPIWIVQKTNNRFAHDTDSISSINWVTIKTFKNIIKAEEYRPLLVGGQRMRETVVMCGYKRV